jgi:hypothetical protein
MELILLPALAHLTSSLFPTIFAGSFSSSSGITPIRPHVITGNPANEGTGSQADRRLARD